MNEIIKVYPNSNTGYYNCYSYAVHRQHWINPENTVKETIKNLRRYGFNPTSNHKMEKSKEKIILYGNRKEVLHFARLLKDGVCISKHGQKEIVKHPIDHPHPELTSICGEDFYGKFLMVLERNRRQRGGE